MRRLAMPGVSVALMGVCHNSLGLTMFFLVLSALFLEVLPSPPAKPYKP